MKLSRTVGYAIQATLQLAESNSSAPIPCSRLAADGGMPERFLLQILRSLVTHGILRSTRGVEGGYKLDREAADISLLDIIEAVDGPLSSSLPSADRISTRARTTLEQGLTEVAEAARERLAAIRLSQLVGSSDGMHGSNDHPGLPPSSQDTESGDGVD